MSWLACSSYGTRDDLSKSRFRAVQFHDDPTNDGGSGHEDELSQRETATPTCFPVCMKQQDCRLKKDSRV